jgi:acyl carrier protein
MFERICEAASLILHVPLNSINAKSSAANLAQWDSLKQLNLALALEEEFNVIFSDEEIVEMQSIQKIHEFLQKHLGK